MMWSQRTGTVLPPVISDTGLSVAPQSLGERLAHADPPPPPMKAAARWPSPPTAHLPKGLGAHHPPPAWPAQSTQKMKCVPHIMQKGWTDQIWTIRLGKYGLKEGRAGHS